MHLTFDNNTYDNIMYLRFKWIPFPTRLVSYEYSTAVAKNEITKNISYISSLR